MILKVQILSFVFSIIFGIFIYFAYNFAYKYLYYSKKIYCLFNSLLFFIDMTLIYFIMFYKINNGMINIYFILLTITTFWILKKFTKRM